MRHALAVASLFVAACGTDHHITLRLGPDDQTLSTGFQCLDQKAGPLAPDPDPLLARGYDAATRRLAFVLLVDVADLGGQFPNCQAEDVAAACGNNKCRALASNAPTRFCKKIEIQNVASVGAIFAAIPPELAKQASDVIVDAPHHPVILRAVLLPESTDCAALQKPAADGSYPAIPNAIANTLGCGYSCPVSLDDVTGVVSLELALPKAALRYDLCDPIITTCAQFPNVASPQ